MAACGGEVRRWSAKVKTSFTELAPRERKYLVKLPKPNTFSRRLISDALHPTQVITSLKTKEWSMNSCTSMPICCVIYKPNNVDRTWPFALLETGSTLGDGVNSETGSTRDGVNS